MDDTNLIHSIVAIFAENTDDTGQWTSGNDIAEAIWDQLEAANRVDTNSYYMIAIGQNYPAEHVKNTLGIGQMEAKVVKLLHSNADDVRRVRHHYELDEYGDGDAIRTDIEEALYHYFSDLID